MKKLIIFACIFLFIETVSAGTSEHRYSIKERLERSEYLHSVMEAESLEKKYFDLKKDLTTATGVSLGIDMSAMVQYGTPYSKRTPLQMYYNPYANWNMFTDTVVGSGSIQFAYTSIKYKDSNANTVGNKMGVVNPINDFPTPSNTFTQLSYTHQMPSVLKWLSVTIGQTPIYNFDGTPYDSNQQVNFINYALSQNASSAYPVSSLGAFITVTPMEALSFSVGFQDAHNVTGETIDFGTFDDGNYTTFANINYNTNIFGLSGQYSILAYYQPSTPEQAYNTIGWSINAMQSISKHIAVFGRINGAVDSPEPISQSYILGMVYTNPFNRNALDQLGFAGAVNKINKSIVGEGSGSVESVLEVYYSVGIGSLVTITPDFQLYINPAESTKNVAFVSSLRVTVMF